MFVVIGKTIMGDAAFEYNGVVFALDAEDEAARRLCKTINQSISSQLGTDRHPKVETFDAISHPGKQIPTNLDEALLKARYIFFSDAYYREDELGLFVGNVAILNSHPDRFIRLRFKKSDAGASDKHRSLASFTGLLLTTEWELCEGEEEKLKRIPWVGFPDEDQAERQQPQGMAGGDDNLDVMNPSISSTSDLSSLASFSEETQAKSVIRANNYNQNLVKKKKKMPTTSTSRLPCPQPWDGDDDLIEDSAETPESEHSGPVGTTDSRQEECSPVAVVIPVRRTAAQGAEGENTLPPADSGRNTSNQHPVHSAFDLPTDEAGNPILL